MLKDSLFLEKLCESNAQGDVYMVFDTKEKRFAVMKRFDIEDEYKIENQFYEYINQKGKGHLLMKVKHVIE